MKKIDFASFETFHKQFQGDTTVTFPLCLECGGACEYTKISSLLPGETEYMAFRFGLPVGDFRKKYLDGIEIDGMVIDILKCSNPCPFLKADFSCEVRGYKPIMCLIYPIYFQPDESGKWQVEVDDVCPLAQSKKARSFFENQGKTLVEQLNIPTEWMERVYEFDEFDFDYAKMVEMRSISLDEYKVYTLNELFQFQIKEE